jgi:hypothetical protein
MKRVYDVNPDLEKGELYGGGHLVYNYSGHKIPYVFRVEFCTEDRDYGMAIVQAFLCGKTGEVLADSTTGLPIRTKFTAWVQVCRKDTPPQKPIVDADGNEWLHRVADGSFGYAEPTIVTG